MICLDKIDMGSFYQTLTLTSENFSRLAALLAYAAENSNIKEFQFSLILVEKFLQNFRMVNLLDLACLAILEGMGVIRNGMPWRKWLTGTRESMYELAKRLWPSLGGKCDLRELAEPEKPVYYLQYFLDLG